MAKRNGVFFWDSFPKVRVHEAHVVNTCHLRPISKRDVLTRSQWDLGELLGRVNKIQITSKLSPGTWHLEHGTYVAPLIRSYLTSVAGFGQVTKTLGNYESPFASYHISLSASDECSQPENIMRSGNRAGLPSLGNTQ